MHEKTILFPLLPITLLANRFPQDALWFTYYASYSMIPLYIKDHNLLMALSVMCGFWALMPTEKDSKPQQVLFGISIMTIVYYAFPAPARYPDLHSVVVSAFSCFVFCLFYVWMLKRQWDLSKSVSVVCSKPFWECIPSSKKLEMMVALIARDSLLSPHSSQPFECTILLLRFSNTRSLETMYALRSASRFAFVGIRPFQCFML